MTQMPIEQATTRGYEPPRVVQFSVFLDNRVGKLLELMEVFEGHALSLVGVSVADAADHAVIRLITSRAELANRLLKRHNLPFSETNILVVELPPGKTLALMCQVLLAAELNIHYAYPLLVRPHGAPAIALYTDDQEISGQILRRKLFTLLGENDLGDNATYPESPGI